MICCSLEHDEVASRYKYKRRQVGGFELFHNQLGKIDYCLQKKGLFWEAELTILLYACKGRYWE